jgi:hypothetical protein
MGRVRPGISLAAIVLVALTGCATSEEWDNWKASPAHFASTSHMEFSWRNRAGRVRVTREDIAAAREEGWWGKAVRVSQEAILER